MSSGLQGAELAVSILEVAGVADEVDQGRHAGGGERQPEGHASKGTSSSSPLR